MLRALLCLLWMFATPCQAAVIFWDTKPKALAHYIMAVYHDLNGEETEAVSDYQQAITLNPAEPAPRLKLGAFYLRQGNISKAAAELKAVSGAAPNTDIDIYLGELYYIQQKYPQAIAQFSKVLQQDSRNASALCFLGAVYADTHEQTKAIDAFRKVLQIDPQNSEALNSLGYLYAEEGIHLDEALKMVQKAVELDPDNGAYDDSLGWVFYKRGQYEESLKALEKAGSLIQDPVLEKHIEAVRKALKQ